MFRLLPSHLQALKEHRPKYSGSLMHCGIPNAYIDKFNRKDLN